MMSIYLHGLLLGLSLVIALGPQNIFLMRQGILREFVLLAILTCFVCDVILLTTSIVGVGKVLSVHKDWQMVMTWLGVGFLLYYGGTMLWRSATISARQINPDKHRISRRQVLVAGMGFSLLNPHAILDSLIIIGGGSSQFPGQAHLFLFGVITASLIWFCLLTSTAYCYSHVLSKVKVWRMIEGFSGLLLVSLACKFAMI